MNNDILATRLVAKQGLRTDRQIIQMASELHYEYGNGTDTGCVRSQNEDAFVLFEAEDNFEIEEKGNLMVICDGMGGAKAGKEASSIAVQEIGKVYYQSKTKDVRAAINQAIRAANQQIFSQSQHHEEYRGMGTTVVAAIVKDDKAFIAHIGDSRCYLIRKREIAQVTEDHTIVQKMVNKGLITPEEARHHPEGHILSRSLGVDVNVEIDITMEPLTLKQGDILILCTDGLSNVVSEDEILQISMSGTAQHAVEKLISLAKERGAPDNVTVQIAKVHGKKPHKTVGTTTIKTTPLAMKKSFPTMLVVILVAILILAGTGFFLWLYEIVDFNQLPGLDWLPYPPASLPPLK